MSKQLCVCDCGGIGAVICVGETEVRGGSRAAVSTDTSGHFKTEQYLR